MATLAQSRARLRPRPVFHYRRPMESIAGDVLAFLIPAANYFTAQIVGSVPGGEFLIFLTLPFVVPKWKRIWRGYNKPLFVLMGLWFLSQLVTDVYRHSPLPSMERGLAAIAFFAVDLAVLSALLYKNYRRIFLFGLGVTVYYLLTSRQLRGVETDSAGLRVGQGLWKFGYAQLLAFSVSLAMCYFYKRRRYVVVFAAFLAMAAINVYQNFRSESLIVVLSAVLILPILKPGRFVTSSPVLELQANLKRVAVLLVLVFISAGFIAKTYSYFAAKGALGDAAQEKYEAQSRGKYGILLGGRSEWLVTVRAVADSPFIGWGSWAENEKYAQMQADILRETGYSDIDADIEGQEIGFLIPAHSHIMQAWVWAGILGTPFWFYSLWLGCRAIFANSVRPSNLAPFFSLLLITFVWDVFFSPFGLARRIMTSFVLVVIASILESGLPNPGRSMGTRVRVLRQRRISPS